MFKKLNKFKKGSISIFVLVFGMVFTVLIGGLVIYGSVEYTRVRRTESFQEALSIAEAGVYYYRWHLAHDPNDYQDGTGSPGPYEHDYEDPESGISGVFSLNIVVPEEGSELVKIESTGWTSEYPSVKRKVAASFGPEPLTQFSFLHNANVWFGQGLTVYGEVLSNGGIRMDGINQSVVKSAKDIYLCGSETGCSPSTDKPGVWGLGGPSELWEYPVPVFDFDSVVTDFNAMKAAAQSSGLYLAPSGAWGYHVVFNSDGSFNVYRVTSASNRKGWSVEGGCENLYQGISGESLVGSYMVSDNKIIYAEDTVWVEGTVQGKTTLVAARLPVGSYTTNLWINGDIVYDTLDGSTTLGVIAQNNIVYVRNLPNDFVINAAMMAQQGRILRHDYYIGGCTYSGWAVRNSLTIYGSVISNQKSYWNYSGWGGLYSGFNTREISFNQQAAEVPPPFFPSTETYKILSWQEE